MLCGFHSQRFSREAQTPLIQVCYTKQMIQWLRLVAPFCVLLCQFPFSLSSSCKHNFFTWRSCVLPRNVYNCIWCRFAVKGYRFLDSILVIKSMRLFHWFQWAPSVFPLRFYTIKTEIIISSYCSQDRNDFPKQSPDIFNCSVLLQSALLKLGLCCEQ